jgi:predicted RNA methylase
MIDRYYTDDKLAKRIVDWAHIKSTDHVLEPSCGAGALSRHFQCEHATLVDADLTVDPVRASAWGFIQGDFIGMFNELESRPLPLFDLAVMNPPYSEGADVAHVAHALRLSRRVVALVRLAFLATEGRYKKLWSWAEISRLAVLVSRPAFHGPEDKGHRARHDYCVIELKARRQGAVVVPVPIEFWRDKP